MMFPFVIVVVGLGVLFAQYVMEQLPATENWINGCVPIASKTTDLGQRERRRVIDYQ